MPAGISKDILASRNKLYNNYFKYLLVVFLLIAVDISQLLSCIFESPVVVHLSIYVSLSREHDEAQDVENSCIEHINTSMIIKHAHVIQQ